MARPDVRLCPPVRRCRRYHHCRSLLGSGFPAQLKTYIENIYVPGIVSAYNDHGQSCGLCRARSLTYITTAGGAYDPRFSFDYLTAMAKEYFGIRETRLIYAECLDICGNDPEAILQSAIDQIERSADR